jgi:bifunctional non-homologous end joining protein LigD
VPERRGRKSSAPDAPAGGRARSTAGGELPDLSQYGQLAEYNRKRQFGVAPEPPGTASPRAAGRPLQFVVQKHRASHLHYDFRLEHRGVMLSWAIPKGPSLDPSVKRLAMQTEPHPMDYNQFEGVIPEGEYGGGTVMIWDKGVWAPTVDDRLGDENDVDRQIRKGDLKFVLLGEKLAGSWVLVNTRGSRNWLLIKHRDEYARDEDLTVTKPLSVVSGRTMAEIGRAAGATPRQLEVAAATDPPAGGEPARPARAARARPAPAARARSRPATGTRAKSAAAASAKAAPAEAAPAKPARRRR